MDTLLNFRLPLSADDQNLFQTGIQNGLRRGLQLGMSPGIVSLDGADVDTSTAACAVVPGTTTNSVSVLNGTIVFKNGEYLDVSSTDITGYPIDPSITETQIMRFQYGTEAAGTLVSNTAATNQIGTPRIQKKSPLGMLVVETLTSYQGQTQEVKDLSIVIAALSFTSSGLTIDLSRDTVTYSRPWATPIDTQHRSYVGTGAVTPQNPHGTTPNDLSAGSYTMPQAMLGSPPVVLARPQSHGRIAGADCEESVLPASFLTDVTGRITGVSGAYYYKLGFWPQTLISVRLASSGSQVAAWIPKGRKVVAVRDPTLFASPQAVNILYTKVDAGSLPLIQGRTQVAVTSPNSNELLGAGGLLLSALSENTVTFQDVGLLPQYFDIQIGADGKAYKMPDCIYCNTALSTWGVAPVPAVIQPRKVSVLKFGFADFLPTNAGISIQVSGKDELGTTISEVITFTGTVPPVVAYTENPNVFVYTVNAYSEVTDYLVLSRSGDGPDTTVTVFATSSPDRPATGDDNCVATVMWNGSFLSEDYGQDMNVVLDRRVVTTGGPVRESPVIAVASSIIPVAASRVTIGEDFLTPSWAGDAAALNGFIDELNTNGVSIRSGYVSRKIAFGSFIGNPVTKCYLKMIPRNLGDWPNSLADMEIQVVLHDLGTTTASVTTTIPSWGQVDLLPFLDTVERYFAVEVKLVSTASNRRTLNDLLAGWVFHIE